MPALAARAPAGPTQVATGTDELRMSLMMSRVEASRPPGVSMRMITSAASRSAAVSSERDTKSRVAGPIGPSTSRTRATRSASVFGDRFHLFRNDLPGPKNHQHEEQQKPCCFPDPVRTACVHARLPRNVELSLLLWTPDIYAMFRVNKRESGIMSGTHLPDGSKLCSND